MSNISEALLAILKEKKRSRQINQKELAKKVGCNQGFMSEMLRGDKRKENKINPYNYLVYLFDRLPNIDSADHAAIEALLPWKCNLSY